MKKIFPILCFMLSGLSNQIFAQSHKQSNVQPENRKAIQKIYENDFGIAWPLKLFISFFTVVIPYNCIVCGFNYFYRMNLLN